MTRTLIALILCASTAWGIEELVPATQPTLDTVTGYRITKLEIQVDARGRSAQVTAEVQAMRADGECARAAGGQCILVRADWREGNATKIIKAINAGTYGAAGTMQKALLVQMQNEGLLPAGTVSGTPGMPDLPTPVPTPTVP